MNNNQDLDTLVNKKERFYFFVLLSLNSLFYFLMFVAFIKLEHLAAGISTIIFYLLFLYVLIIFSQGLFIGAIKNHSVKVTENQLPGVLRSVQNLCQKMDIKNIPEVYIVESGGMLNAFATKFFFGSKSFVVIYSEILELAFEKGEGAIEFVIAHELAHVKRRHMDKRYLLMPMILIPLFGMAYYRACEYTCDSFAASMVGNVAAKQGLSVLGLGKKLYTSLNVEDLIKSAVKNSGFWTLLDEKLSTHPPLFKRFLNIEKV